MEQPEQSGAYSNLARSRTIKKFHFLAKVGGDAASKDTRMDHPQTAPAAHGLRRLLVLIPTSQSLLF